MPKESWGLFEWLAIVGAAAWAPTILSWAYQWMKRPKVRCVFSNPPEIGFTSFGPVFNLTVGLIGEDKPSIVEDVRLKVAHANGRVQSFRWAFAEEPAMQAVNADGSSASFKKDQSGIAIFVDTRQVAARKVGFQTIESRQQRRQKIDAWFDYLRAEGVGLAGPIEPRHYEIQQFFDLVESTTQTFAWIEGDYEMELSLHSRERRRPFVFKGKFSLSTADAGRLRMNLELVRRAYVEPEQVNKLWSWVYPELEQL